jgi:lipoprotein NlpI
MVDYSKAIAAHPKYAWPYHARGCLQYDAHEFTEALADFQKVLELDYSHQDYSTYRIWLIRTRLGEPDDAATALQSYLARGATKGKPEDWSIITVNFLAGQLAELDFLAAAKNEDPKKEAAQLCQAFFYAGSKRLFEGDKATARAYFQKSIATNEKRCTEYCSALAELKLLGDQEN